MLMVTATWQTTYWLRTAVAKYPYQPTNTYFTPIFVEGVNYLELV